MWYVFLCVLVALVVVKLTKISQFWKDRGIPYEPYWRYLYRVLWQIHTRSISEVQKETCDRYGPMYGSYRGLKPALTVTDVEHIKDVFIKQFDNFFSRSFEFTTGEPLWDNTIIQLPYDQWKGVRTIMGMTFTTSKMRGMILKLDVISKRLMTKLESVTETEMSLSPYLKPYAIDSITAIALGMDVNSLDNPNSDFIKYVTQIFQPGVTSVFFFIAPQLMKYIPFVHFPPKKTVDFIREVSKHVLEDKRKNLDEVIKNGTADILDLHLIAQREDPKTILTDEMLASQAFLFLLGTDNTVLTLELTTFFLAVTPEAQQRAYEEVKSIVGDKPVVDYEDLQKMKFVEASLLESLRIVPLGGFIDRVCTQKTVVAGQEIHEGMVVEANFAHMHANPEYFPEPEKYKPERFLKNQDGNPNELSAFMMFGHGPKNCVGKRLALMNMQVVLANLLLKFKMVPTANSAKLPLKIKPGLRQSDVTVEPLNIKLKRLESEPAKSILKNH